MKDSVMEMFVSDLASLNQKSMDEWNLEPTDTRRRVADRIMKMLCEDADCTGSGGAANATAGLCLALAESLAGNSIPGNWKPIAALVHKRVKEELDKTAEAMGCLDRRGAVTRPSCSEGEG